MITCKYSCPECGLVDREVQVPARTTEDVVVWVQQKVGRAILIDHCKVSPRCRAQVIKNLMIPTPPEAEFLGQQIE